MKLSEFKTVKDIVDWRMCIGCGACAPLCPEKKISLVNILHEGIRPRLSNTDCGTCTDCLKTCPAYEHLPSSTEAPLDPLFGPVLEVWEAYAVSPETRRTASSGGILSALAICAVEQLGFDSVFHIGIAENDPLANKTYRSRSAGEILARSGSRYAPASACDCLLDVEAAQGPVVFIGQPSEIAALRKAQELRPTLQEKVGLALSFFCAGSPTTKSTMDLIKKHGVKPEEVTNLRYRGRGWPGHFEVYTKEEKPVISLTYKQSWGELQKQRPIAIHLWPDGTGESADISCGDAWHKPQSDGNPGESLVIIRTERGRKIFKEAVSRGYIKATPGSMDMVYIAAKGLAEKRQAIWGRRLAMKWLFIPVTKMNDKELLKCWKMLPLKDKIKSLTGTLKRAVSRKYYKSKA